MLIVSRACRIRTCDLVLPKHPLYQTELMPDDASTNSCMKVPDLRISYTERKYIRDDRMRFGSSRHPEYATSSYRALRSYHSSFSIASVIGQKIFRTHRDDPIGHGPCDSRISRRERMSKPSLLLSSVLRLVLRRECLAFLSDSFLFDLVDTDGVRTHDPLLAKQMFYQLNYWPIRSFRFFNMQILFSTGSFVVDQNILKRSGVVNPSASKKLNFF